ncbi:MAG: hypothetical protein IPM69_13085 [Ignavibacteria bacterium]|nr:hypothetical protein [Ignavibacteria bacterium]
MKNLISLLMVALILASPVFAQKPFQDTIPQLKEWWVAPSTIKGLGRYGVSHIPNFYHGKDAMAVSINNGTMVTWLNRFPGDTTNIFSWKGGGPVLQGDFNGDGVTDYYAGGYLYRGIVNGEPPDTASVLYKLVISEKVLDVNHDGYDDVVSIPSPGARKILHILYGASDFKNMKSVDIPTAVSIDSTMTIENSFMGADRDMRLIAYSSTNLNDQQRKFSGYVLFRAHWNKGDTLPIIEKLSKIIRYWDTDIPFRRGGWVYTGSHTVNKFFIAKEYLNGEIDNNNIIIYDVTNNIFQEKSKFRMDSASFIYPLQESIDSDEYEDLVMRVPGKFLFYSGKDLGNEAISPLATYHISCATPPQRAYSIGDVTHDGIADIVTGVGCILIIEGKKEPVGVIEGTGHLPPFTLTDPSPHPLKRGIPASVKVVIPQMNSYVLELFTLSGQRIGEIFHRVFEVGEQTFIVDISSLSLSQGTYSIKLRSQDGIIVGQRTIIIE